MKRVTISIIMILLASSVNAQQQRQCNEGLPCGIAPWRLPALPALPSPTPMPTAAITVAPTNAPDSSTPSSPYTNDIQVDTDPILNQAATLNAIILATPMRVSAADGSYSATDEADYSTYQDNAAGFFSYVKGITQVNIGVLTPLALFFITSFVLSFTISIGRILTPVIAAIFGLIRKIVQLILDFIPL
jgi:hypothetical protein